MVISFFSCFLFLFSLFYNLLLFDFIAFVFLFQIRSDCERERINAKGKRREEKSMKQRYEKAAVSAINKC